MNPLTGIHHITAISSSAEKIYDFFTHVLGMRLVKKTINQEFQKQFVEQTKFSVLVYAYRTIAHSNIG